MRLHALGDTAYLITLAEEVSQASLARVAALVERLRAERPVGVADVVPAGASVAVLYTPEDVATHPGELPWHAVAQWIETKLAEKRPAAKAPAPREHVIPLCYGGEHGPDLGVVAEAARMSPEAVVRMHAATVYTVACVGFTPGFAYLFGLPARLATARRATPRTRVPAGSLGIGGAQTGIYPRETPGGWQLIGRTRVELFDPQAEPPALLAAGDRVKFKPVDALPAARAVVAARAPLRGLGRPHAGVLEIVKPGGLATVQDLGRPGRAGQGVATGGALDRWAAAAANLVVGNTPEAALLECTYVGPVLRFHAPATVALLGAEVAGIQTGKPLRVAAGQILDCSVFTRGARLYVAVAGGLRVPLRLGSAATHVNAGFGGHEGRALAAGDTLTYLPSDPERDGSAVAWRIQAPVAASPKKTCVEVRLVPGVDWEKIFRDAVPGGANATLEAMRFRLSAKSDRMGLRLDGATLAVPSDASSGASRPVLPGTVQLPPDGRPIVLMAEGQVIGGYPQLGQVASIDLPKLAQAGPGAEIAFRVVSLSAAQQARLRVAAELAKLRTGLQLQR
jgi:KipI family sensor histidine kinase inhibitor